jgi:hypothetical protein
VLDDGHLLSAVSAFNDHGRPDVETLCGAEQFVIETLETLPALPGSVIGPADTDPPIDTSQVNSEIRKPLNPSLLIVADIEPLGLTEIAVAPASAALTAMSAAASSTRPNVLRMMHPPSYELSEHGQPNCSKLEQSNWIARLLLA